MTAPDASLVPSGLLASLWPYALLLVFGVLPAAMWRILAVVLSRGLPETSAVIVWVRYVATALLSGVVIKLLLAPTGALANVPLAGRLAGIVAGAAAFLLIRRSMIAGVIAGEAVLVASAWWWG
ncbi:AzlD domain-containing protein [uncultured Alsobacter sp.]|uniref:AzlD domain-containing protein n=1 Tax=uncultured Alsobacter sp. TaxID=1748258 RepID=UPI0025DC16A1|nr:AzlD domain-containing protein [uncultured Alsobacter sp.]